MVVVIARLPNTTAYDTPRAAVDMRASSLVSSSSSSSSWARVPLLICCVLGLTEGLGHVPPVPAGECVLPSCLIAHAILVSHTYAVVLINISYSSIITVVMRMNTKASCKCKRVLVAAQQHEAH